MTDTVTGGATKLVWDPLVRVGHWLLVAGFAVAYITEGKPEWLHVWAGYLLAAVVILRVVWGVVGPRHARFTSFVRGRRAVFDYLAALIRFRAPRHIGHSPAGGAMVVALLIGLAATTGTGMTLFAIDDGKGPLSYVVAQLPPPVAADGTPIAPALVAPGQKVRKPKDPRVRLVKEVHEWLANLTLLLIGFHLAGVALASVAHKENLVRSMVHGRKPARPGDID